MKLLLGTAALLLMLTACGGDDGDDKSDKSSPGGESSDVPACTDIWVVGQTLPADYEGCRNGDTVEASVYYDCEDGSKLTGFDDRFYALYGGEIQENGADGAAYSAAFDDCKGL